MQPQRWEKVAELYHSACQRLPAERNAFLAGACEGDEELRNEVESLLKQNVSRQGMLERVAGDARLWNAAPAFRSDQAAPERPLPASIGRYRILRLVGEGGMGVVYEAAQDHPRRTVALKVIRPGLSAPELLRRFEHESQALGRLQHPGIAQIYEAGIADASFAPQPYFAMEFIHGFSLLRFAAEHHLNVHDRIEVMVRVCEAVHHAHQRGIIHRDLKPGNILVDETGQPKVLDFGVACVTDGDAQVTRQTGLGELVGTLAYMSPEQVRTDTLQVDARSDVYALGVVLYELLAGRLPYEVSPRIFEAARTIREEDPAPLRLVSRIYRGDLETIVAKALEKDKTRRYASAAEFGADLRRHLDNQPILAMPPSARYRVRKFASRHKGLVAAATVVFVVLLAGILVSTRQAIRANRAERAALLQRDRAIAAERAATRERDRALSAEQVAAGERIRAQQERNRAIEESRRADTQSAAAKAVSDFLQNDLLAEAGARAQAGPNTRPDPDLKVRTALDRAAARIAGKFDPQPAVEASIRQTIGNTYRDLGLFAEAEQQMQRALDLRIRVLGAEHADTLHSMDELALAYEAEGKYGPAEALLTKVVEARRRLRGGRHSDTLASMNNLAMMVVAQGDHSRAERLFAEVLERERDLLGEQHPETLAAMNNLAAQYVNQGKYPPAEELYKKVVEIKRRVLGEQHPGTLLSMNSLGVLYRDQGKYGQAETLLTRVLDARRLGMGETHPDTLASMNSLGLLYQAQARYAQAEPLFTRVSEARRRVLGEEHPETLRALNNLAELYRRLNRASEAELLFKNVLEARRRVLGPDHPNTSGVLASLGGIKLEQRAYADAEPLLREALRGYEKTSSNTWRRYHTQSMLGASLAGLGKYGEAEPPLLSGYEGLIQRQNSIPAENRPILEEVRQSIVQLYQGWDKPQEALAWRTRKAKQ